jgi:hypothetical protein
MTLPHLQISLSPVSTNVLPIQPASVHCTRQPGYHLHLQGARK